MRYRACLRMALHGRQACWRWQISLAASRLFGAGRSQILRPVKCQFRLFSGGPSKPLLLPLWQGGAVRGQIFRFLQDIGAT